MSLSFPKIAQFAFLVGRSPWTAADALVGLPGCEGKLIPLARAGPGGPAQTLGSAPRLHLDPQLWETIWHWAVNPRSLRRSTMGAQGSNLPHRTKKKSRNTRKLDPRPPSPGVSLPRIPCLPLIPRSRERSVRASVSVRAVVLHRMRNLMLRLGHRVDERLLSRDKALHALTCQVHQLFARQWRIDVRSLTDPLQIELHLLSSGIQQLLLGINERVRALASQLCELSRLLFIGSIAMFGAFGCFGCILGNFVQELFLGLHEVFHALARHVRYSLTGKRLPGFCRLHPRVGLFVRYVQEVLLQADVILHTPAQQIRHRGRRRCWTHSFLQTLHYDLILAISQIEQDLLRCNKIGHSLAGEFAHGRHGALPSESLAQSVHGHCVLPHHQIQQNPLSGEVVLRSLLYPFGKQGHWRGSPRRSLGLLRFNIMF